MPCLSVSPTPSRLIKRRAVQPSRMRAASHHFGQQLLLGLCIALCTVLASPFAQAADKLRPIGVEITTHLGDQQTFREHDVVSFLLTLEHDAYVTAIYVDAKHNVFQLIPNKNQPEHFYKADLFIPIPPQNSGYTFKVQPPFGTETLWVFASDSAAVKLDGKVLDNGLVQLTGNIDAVRKAIQLASGKWFGEAKVSITTSAR